MHRAGSNQRFRYACVSEVALRRLVKDELRLQKQAWRRGVTGFQQVPRKTTDMGTRHPHCRRLHLCKKEQRRAQAGSRAGRDAGLRAPARPPSAAARGPPTPTSTPTPPPPPTSTPTSTRRRTRPRPGARCPGGTPGLQEGPGGCRCLGRAHGLPDSGHGEAAAGCAARLRTEEPHEVSLPEPAGRRQRFRERPAGRGWSLQRGPGRTAGQRGRPGERLGEKLGLGPRLDHPLPAEVLLRRPNPPQPEEREWWEGRACFLCRIPKGVLVFVWLGFCFFSSSALSSAGRGVEGLSLSRRQTSSTSSF